MIGGEGQTSDHVRAFFGGKNFYGIPSNGVTKNGNPCGRIVHDYGYHPERSYSVNATHSCTSVRYLTTQEVVAILDSITYFIKGDLENGFRQFGTHPVDWRFQVYCNGPREHYIDLACPFGKTNSPLEFCPPVALFAKSLAIRYTEDFRVRGPALGTHVDDIFGGFKSNHNYRRSAHFREWMCAKGKDLTLSFNMKPSKTPLPAKTQVILGRKFDSSTRRITTAADKIEKYLGRVKSMILERTTNRKKLEKLHGCLNYVADIEPFGRPFLDHLTTAMSGAKPTDAILLPPYAKMGLKIQYRILRQNKGTSFDFVLNRLPRTKSNIFVDASTSQGVGGCCGSYFFYMSWANLKRLKITEDFIARKELLACIVAIMIFEDVIQHRLLRLHTDNDSAYHQIKKSRSSNSRGTRLLAIWEYVKQKAECKIAPVWIPSAANRTADELSRGSVPRWLQKGGKRRYLQQHHITLLKECPIKTWLNVLTY